MTNYEAESICLGALLLSRYNSDARMLITKLQPEMFTNSHFRQIYVAIQKQALTSDKIDMIQLSSDYGLDFGDLATLMNDCTSVTLMMSSAKFIMDDWEIRELTQIFKFLEDNLSKATPESRLKIKQRALSAMDRIRTNRTEIKPVALSSLAESYVELLEERATVDDTLLNTGIKALDDLLGGINGSDITIVAGRPATGKTAFSLLLAKNIAEQDKKLLYFSLEMSSHQLIDRIVSSNSTVSVSKLRNPRKMNEYDFAKVSDAIGTVRGYPIYFVDRGGLKTSEIIDITKEFIDENPDTKAILIDYLGLIDHGDIKYGANKLIERSMSELKALAKNTNVPIILLCQLNRDVESRKDKRPMMSDLRDSGSIEQDASQILMLYREKAYDQKCDHDYAEVIVVKNRFEQNGTVYMKFEGGQFKECDQQLACSFIESRNKKSNGKGKSYAKQSIF